MIAQSRRTKFDFRFLLCESSHLAGTIKPLDCRTLSKRITIDQNDYLVSR